MRAGPRSRLAFQVTSRLLLIVTLVTRTAEADARCVCGYAKAVNDKSILRAQARNDAARRCVAGTL